jgi:hypothetical protein
MSKSPLASSLALPVLAALAAAACSSELDPTAAAAPDAAASLDRRDAAIDGDPGADAGPSSAPSFVVGGTVTGLLGTGLELGLGVERLGVARDGEFRFETPMRTGATYRAEVLTQPRSPHQTCTIAPDVAAGTMGSADVRTVAVQCSTDTFVVRVRVSGLVGGGLVLVNGGERLAVDADGTRTFATPVASGATYAVQVETQPASGTQHCRVERGEGVVVDADIAGVAVVCESMDCVPTATIAVGIRTHEVDVHGAALAVWQGEAAGALELYDVSNPSRVARTGQAPLDAFSGCNSAGNVRFSRTGEYAYVYGGGCAGLPVVDVRDHQRPRALAMAAASRTPYGTMDLAICGDMAYAAIQLSGVAAIDLGDPAAPALVDESVIEGQTYPYKVTCVTHDSTVDYVYLGDGGSVGLAGLRVFAFDKRARRLTALGSHTPSTSSWGGAAIPVSARELYVPLGDSTRLALFDVEDKRTIRPPTTFEIYPNLNARLLRLGHHLVVVSNLDLVYVDVSAPAAPVPRWSKTLGTPSNPPDRVHAFVAGGRSHLAYNLNGGTTLSLCRVEGVAADGEL